MYLSALSPVSGGLLLRLNEMLKSGRPLEVLGLDWRELRVGSTPRPRIDRCSSSASCNPRSPEYCLQQQVFGSCSGDSTEPLRTALNKPKSKPILAAIVVSHFSVGLAKLLTDKSRNLGSTSLHRSSTLENREVAVVADAVVTRLSRS